MDSNLFEIRSLTKNKYCPSGDNVGKCSLEEVLIRLPIFKGLTRTNGSEPHTTVKGQILPDGNLDFTRSTGNWRQHYLGRIFQKEGDQAMRLEGMFGNLGQEKHEWYAERTD